MSADDAHVDIRLERPQWKLAHRAHIRIVRRIGECALISLVSTQTNGPEKRPQTVIV